MRKFALIAAISLALGVGAQAPQQNSSVRIPDAPTASKIAVSKLEKVYGKKQIESEQPFTATLKDGVWSVFGTLWCSDGHGGRTQDCVGGVAQIKLRERDGKVLSLYHGK